MAFKDTFNKIISYFDTDGVSEVEEELTSSPADEAPSRPQQPTRPRQPQQVARPSAPQQPNHRVNPERHYSPTPGYQEQKAATSAATSHREQYQQTPQQEKITIALKYPKKYEDAQEIVDLFIGNECVLIDFQYMLDAQARRCLDFIDGASRVLYGTLQKVGASMYLLTPSNVSVSIEDMNIPNNGQDISFDFDMKRR
ncbi:cell division protein SepF [Streptococcus phocae subsp. phocae]|uniref:Cell division protein SepF n=1 Tax=Streptococcus phocae TaxID=119224 RepID=A0A0P6SRY3_9STRE|nr:cell division protein SepF [Streptococcus phocae]KPJ22480.1 cell division protein SepF [Streptococcus phocae]